MLCIFTILLFFSPQLIKIKEMHYSSNNRTFVVFDLHLLHDKYYMCLTMAVDFLRRWIVQQTIK